jgi:hypothetical protein
MTYKLIIGILLGLAASWLKGWQRIAVVLFLVLLLLADLLFPGH